MIETCDVVILGGGLCGLAAATQLGERCVVVEREAVPGGLVRSLRLGEWWFDHVLHLLYFWDGETERIIRDLLGTDLQTCPPQAFVETPAGTTRYPFQMHLGSLPAELVAQCLDDLARVTYTPDTERPGNFLEYLERGYGRAICEAFLFPYNRKMWGRPLETLAPSGFQWNIPRPDFNAVVRGALDPEHHYRAYNAGGFYPRPQAQAPLRGMEVISQRLAERVPRLWLNHELLAVDPAEHLLTLRTPEGDRTLHFRHACLSTVPLPALLRRCANLPEHVADTVENFKANRVVMVYIALRGKRPDCGHWRYYSDPDISFTRLVYMHAFDPLSAPADGWGLMAEITAPSEHAFAGEAACIERVLRDARKVGAIGDEQIVASACRVFDPAYVVFDRDTETCVEIARFFLREHGITPLGRYGRWEYSSMAQVMRDGFQWGAHIAGQLGHTPPENLHWRETPATEK